ncbi:adhesion G protein-coupled receptor B2 [Trichonephila clavipes]|nr:adhesion G protein-coupled receptor B2 [Trichonephila clavipes]
MCVRLLKFNALPLPRCGHSEWECQLKCSPHPLTMVQNCKVPSQIALALLSSGVVTFWLQTRGFSVRGSNQEPLKTRHVEGLMHFRLSRLKVFLLVWCGNSRYKTLNCNKTTMYYSIDMNFFYSKDNLVALHFKYDFWHMTATAGSDVVQSGRLIFDDFFQHLWPYIGNNTANVFQMVKRLWLIRIDQ